MERMKNKHSKSKLKINTESMERGESAITPLKRKDRLYIKLEEESKVRQQQEDKQREILMYKIKSEK